MEVAPSFVLGVPSYVLIQSQDNSLLYLLWRAARALAAAFSDGGCILGWWLREASIAGIAAAVVCAVLLYWVALVELV